MWLWVRVWVRITKSKRWFNRMQGRNWNTRLVREVRLNEEACDMIASTLGIGQRLRTGQHMVNSSRSGVEPGIYCLLSQDTTSILWGSTVVTNFMHHTISWLACMYSTYSTHRYYRPLSMRWWNCYKCYTSCVHTVIYFCWRICTSVLLDDRASCSLGLNTMYSYVSGTQTNQKEHG